MADVIFSNFSAIETRIPYKFPVHVANIILRTMVKILFFCLMVLMNFQKTYRKIADIIKHRVLPHCGVIVSSRPYASVKL